MTALLLALPILSLLVLAAHFLRAGILPLVVVALLAIAMLGWRRPWVARTVQIVLILGGLDWIRTILSIKAIRDSLGQPAGRMLIILGSVALVTFLSALLFQTRRLKRVYFRDSGHGPAPPEIDQ